MAHNQEAASGGKGQPQGKTIIPSLLALESHTRVHEPHGVHGGVPVLILPWSILNIKWRFPRKRDNELLHGFWGGVKPGVRTGALVATCIPRNKEAPRFAQHPLRFDARHTSALSAWFRVFACVPRQLGHPHPASAPPVQCHPSRRVHHAPPWWCTLSHQPTSPLRLSRPRAWRHR